MERNNWTFAFDVTEIVDGATKQLKWREERTAWWKAQQETLKDEIRDKGISVHDWTDLVGGSNTRGYNAPQLNIDQSLTKKLQDAFYKTQEHDGAAKEYKRWLGILAREKPNRVLQLTEDDVEFFFMEAVPEE